MSGLIDRQALKDAVKRYADEPIKKKDRKCQAICLDMLGTIDAQPTIDALPVAHGEWIYDGKFAELNKFYCSKCKRTEFRMSDYCPNCGARMDGERREG